MRDIISKGNLKVFKIELKKQKKIDKDLHQGQTALFYAVGDNKTKIALYLLKIGANPNIPNHVGILPIHKAAEEGNIKLIKALLKSGSTLNFSDLYGGTPLISAIQNKHFEVAKFLIEKGAAINIQTNKGSTPLCESISLEDVKFVQFLIVNGVDLNAFCCKRQELIDMAFGGKRKERKNMCESPLHNAARIGNLKIIKLLLRQKVNLKIKNDKGKYPYQITSSKKLKRLLRKK